MATKCCEHQSSWFFVKDRCGVARHVWTIPVDLYPLALGQDPLKLPQPRIERRAPFTHLTQRVPN